MELGKYLKSAFLNRWNLLALCGGVGFALVSGVPDIALPIVLAAEAAYLGLLGTHSRFQASASRRLPSRCSNRSCVHCPVRH